MGLSVSVATVIIFSAIVVLAADFVQTYDEVTNATRDAMDERDMLAHERESTAVDIVSVARNGSILTINITNEGAEVLDPAECDLVIDGALATGLVRWNETSVVGFPGSSIWGPGETVSYSISYAMDPARILIVTVTGVTGAYSGV